MTPEAIVEYLNKILTDKQHGWKIATLVYHISPTTKEIDFIGEAQVEELKLFQENYNE